MMTGASIPAGRVVDLYRRHSYQVREAWRKEAIPAESTSAFTQKTQF